MCVLFIEPLQILRFVAFFSISFVSTFWVRKIQFLFFKSEREKKEPTHTKINAHYCFFLYIFVYTLSLNTESCTKERYEEGFEKPFGGGIKYKTEVTVFLPIFSFFLLYIFLYLFHNV